jgi:hypothetical protein
MGAVKDGLRVKKAGPRLASRQRYAQPCFCFSDFFIQHVAVVGLLARWHLKLFIISSLKRKSKT